MSEGIERAGGKRRPAPEQWFVGNVEMEGILDDSEHAMRHGRVHFHDGARTKWHLHTGSQVLYFVAGQGMVEDASGTRIDTEAGDIVHVQGGTRHIHGARPGTSATHVAITAGDTIWETDPRYSA